MWKIRKLLKWLFLRIKYPCLKIDVIVNSPFRIDGAEWVEIGSRSSFQKGSWIYCDPSKSSNKKLIIGKNCVFGYNNHIAAMTAVTIGDSVLTANNVYISDNIHDYKNIELPIMSQGIVFKGPVSIGSGSWIGENVCIIGSSIGRNSVIGANSVVTKDIPDFSIAVGAPAKVIRQYDHTSGNWINV